MVGGKSFSYHHGSQEFGLTGPIVMIFNVHVDILCHSGHEQENMGQETTDPMPNSHRECCMHVLQ
jgi:hypothetical protein